MISDWLLAEALAIERWKGAGAFSYIAGRMDTLALAGDAAGVDRFTAIAAKLNQLRTGSLQ